MVENGKVKHSRQGRVDNHQGLSSLAGMAFRISHMPELPNMTPEQIAVKHVHISK
jgi:hypothetical protein